MDYIFYSNLEFIYFVIFLNYFKKLDSQCVVFKKMYLNFMSLQMDHILDIEA